jgi:hypothetical protein
MMMGRALISMKTHEIWPQLPLSHWRFLLKLLVI